MKNKFVSIKQFIKIAARFDTKLTEDSFKKMKHGDFIAKKINEKTGQETCYWLKRIWITPFEKYYPLSKRMGKEIFISSFKI